MSRKSTKLSRHNCSSICGVCATTITGNNFECVCNKCNGEFCAKCTDFNKCEQHEQIICCLCWKSCDLCYSDIKCPNCQLKCYRCSNINCLACSTQQDTCQFCNLLICRNCIIYELYRCNQCDKKSCDECRNAYGSDNFGICPSCRSTNFYQVHEF